MESDSQTRARRLHVIAAKLAAIVVRASLVLGRRSYYEDSVRKCEMNIYILCLCTRLVMIISYAACMLCW